MRLLAIIDQRILPWRISAEEMRFWIFFLSSGSNGPPPITSFVPGKSSCKNSSGLFSGARRLKNTKTGVGRGKSGGAGLRVKSLVSTPRGTITIFFLNLLTPDHLLSSLLRRLYEPQLNGIFAIVRELVLRTVQICFYIQL